MLNFSRFTLIKTKDRLELQDNNKVNSNPLYVDFLSASISYRIKHGGGTKQLIAKAVGIKNNIRPTILDVTAGLGTDAFILASLGCKVTMIERSPIIGALLKDGLDRLKSQNNNSIQLDLYLTQAYDYLINIEIKPDVIYLDPMYPIRKKTALGKKTMRIIHEIVGNDEDIDIIFTLALKCANKRVVVKRPNYADYLCKIKPTLELSSHGSSRYDIYLI